jgi:hypothetical protein
MQLQGVILAQGGTHAGWSLYVKDGKPKFVLCFDLSPAGRSSFRVCARRARRARTRGWCSRKERPPSLLGGRACPGSALPEQRSCGSSNGSPNKLFNHTIHENQLVRSLNSGRDLNSFGFRIASMMVGLRLIRFPSAVVRHPQPALCRTARRASR